MSGQWKGALTGSITQRLAPSVLQSSAARSTAGFGAGDDGLVGGVEVGGGDDLVGLAFDVAELGSDAGAGGFDVGEVEAEDGGHCAFSGGDGGLHELAAGADGADGVGEGESVGGDVGGVLAEGVAGGVGDGEIAGFQLGLEHAEGRDGDGEDGGLRVLGELEGVFGTVEDEVGEGETEGVVGLFEDGAGGGVSVVEGAAHAYGLRTLSGEEEGDGGVGGGAHQDSLAAGGVDGLTGLGRAVDCWRNRCPLMTMEPSWVGHPDLWRMLGDCGNPDLWGEERRGRATR